MITSLGALIVAVSIAAGKFVDDHARVPTPSERKSLTFASLIASVLVSLALTLTAFFALGGLPENGKALWDLARSNLGLTLGVMLFLLAVSAVVLWFSYAGFAHTQLKHLLKKKETTER